MTGHGDGAGGIQLQANANNMQLTNNVLENNGGVFAGGIGVGQPYAHGSRQLQRPHRQRPADRQRRPDPGPAASASSTAPTTTTSPTASSARTSASSTAPASPHIGLSPGGKIHDNQIYYNDSVDSGAGIAIESELPGRRRPLGDGSGAVDVDRNLIQSNYSRRRRRRHLRARRARRSRSTSATT